jgi:glycerol-3-phosphate dehydrogenase (NAD(P)+)
LNITIIGAGSFGTALAQVLSKTNFVNLILRNKEIADSINTKNLNCKYFPNIKLNSNIKAYFDYFDVRDSNIIIFAIPSKSILEQFVKIKKFIKKETIIINTAKGFAKKDKTILSLLKKKHKNCFSILGPTFASNLMKGEFSSFTVASDEIKHYDITKKIFTNTKIILDYSVNYKLIELSSILKNIFAIANGLFSSLDDGVNTKYAFLTQSYKEMNYILKEIFNEIGDDYYKNGVFGDLLLTSLNDQSRNKTLGQLIGRGFYKINDKSSVTLEGARSTKKVYKIIKKKNIKCPIITFVYKVLNGKNVYEEYNICMNNIVNN